MRIWKISIEQFLCICIVWISSMLTSSLDTELQYKSKLNWKIPPFQCGNGNCWLGFYWKWLNELWAVILPKFYHLELFLHFDIKIVGYWGSWESKPNINIYTIYTFACIHIAVNNSNVTELNTSTFNTFSWLIKF